MLGPYRIVMSSQNSTALLLIAHGSRNPQANEDLFYMAEELNRTNRYHLVEAAFLEIAKPTIPEGAARCVQQGARVVLMIPYFLSAGVHARQDLQNYQTQLRQEFPNVEFRLGKPFGRHPLLLKIIEERAQEVEEE